MMHHGGMMGGMTWGMGLVWLLLILLVLGIAALVKYLFSRRG
jgi:type IV secretory pathway VirB2 component (pilin)